MNFISINKIFLLFTLVFVLSCQDKSKILINENYSSNITIEQSDIVDFSSNNSNKNKFIDFYTNENVIFNFDQKLNKIKINNYERKYENHIGINLIYNDTKIYSLNHKGDLLSFDINTGKLIDRYTINLNIEDKTPISFSLIENNFIIAYKSGEVLKSTPQGEVLWNFKKSNFLNTPIKVKNDFLMILYPNQVIFLSSENGEIIFEKKYDSNNIIQSNGGKIQDYFNLIFFILPSSKFSIIDTFLFEQYNIEFNNNELNTSLNNLNDDIYIYKNLFLYLDNNNYIYTFDLLDNKRLLNNYKLNSSNSTVFYNNTIIRKNKNSIEFYNIFNGNLFSRTDLNKKLNKEFKLIHAINIENKLHLFTDNGNILIFNENLQLLDEVDLKIKKINRVYNYQDKIFISTIKGTTYIY